MSDDLKLGQIITGEAHRDAVHIAVVPLEAGERLYRGSEVRLKLDSHTIALQGDYFGGIGIVDPFLDTYGVEKGQRFYCFLKPGSVTGMRHHWQHPSFDKPLQVSTNESERWLREFCDEWNFDWNELIREASSYSNDRYVVAQGTDLHSASELGKDEHLFWEHLEKYTGKKFDQNHRDDMGWSCSC